MDTDFYLILKGHAKLKKNFLATYETDHSSQFALIPLV